MAIWSKHFALGFNFYDHETFVESLAKDAIHRYMETDCGNPNTISGQGSISGAENCPKV